MQLHRRLPVSALFTLIAACASSEPPPGPPPPPPAPPASSAQPTSSAAVPAGSGHEAATPAPSLPAVELVVGAPAEPPAKAPSVKLKSPAKDQVIAVDKAGDFEVRLDVKGWDAPEGGKHVHLILDNRPYKRIDDVKQPIKLKDIDPSYTLSEGQHVLVAFASRPTHEAVKPMGKEVPLAVVPFFIGKKGEVKFKEKDPLVVYSRPKGANDGAPPAEGILVDFYLHNAELGEGKLGVQALLKGPGVSADKPVVIRDWKPYRIKNARTGAYSLQLVLVDKDGKPVPGPYNDVTREFSVNLEAAAPDHGHHGGTDKAAPKGEPAKK